MSKKNNRLLAQEHISVAIRLLNDEFAFTNTVNLLRRSLLEMNKVVNKKERVQQEYDAYIKLAQQKNNEWFKMISDNVLNSLKIPDEPLE